MKKKVILFGIGCCLLLSVCGKRTQTVPMDTVMSRSIDSSSMDNLKEHQRQVENQIIGDQAFILLKDYLGASLAPETDTIIQYADEIADPTLLEWLVNETRAGLENSASEPADALWQKGIVVVSTLAKQDNSSYYVSTYHAVLKEKDCTPLLLYRERMAEGIDEEKKVDANAAALYAAAYLETAFPKEAKDYEQVRTYFEEDTNIYQCSYRKKSDQSTIYFGIDGYSGGLLWISWI